MAVRLSVIMVHTSPAAGAAQRLSEAVVGELIGLGGIDLTLVGPLGTLDESSTDHLTLRSLEGDVAVLDWQSPDQILASLASIGFDGCRARHADDRDLPDLDAAVPENSQRVYCFDLNRFTDAESLIASLVKLKETRQVRTVSIGIAGVLPMSGRRTTEIPSGEPASVRIATRGKPAGIDHTGSTDGRAASMPEPQAASMPEPSGASTDRLDLDELIDRLDELDP